MAKTEKTVNYTPLATIELSYSHDNGCTVRMRIENNDFEGFAEPERIFDYEPVEEMELN